MSSHSFFAVDLGAESGRTILGTLEDGRLRITEKSRFQNGMLHLHGHWHWNIYRLFEETKKGLHACAAGKGGRPESMAIDTWGVDFALLADDGSVLGLPYAYRDLQTDGAMETFFELIPRERIYALTGNQFLQFNSLFQLFALKKRRSPLLEAAKDLLFMPDLFNFLFTGIKKTEFTCATTSQLFNPVKHAWEDAFFDALCVPRTLMQEIVEPGTVIGRVREEIRREMGTGSIPVVAVASHDTGSAVAAVPAEGENWAFMSSGTWSLLGVEVDSPVLTEEAMKLNFTNEGGVEGTIRFLKNINGLWLLQQLKKGWDKERDYRYGELMVRAEATEPFKTLLDPDRKTFLNPTNMAEAMDRYFVETEQPVPKSPAEYVRCVLESLALKYRLVLDQLKGLTGRSIDRIHVIGGGSQNELLCRFTANATGLLVLAGPVEATAIGNILVQAMALGHVDSLPAMRAIIRGSFESRCYEPETTDRWEAAYERYIDLVL